MPNTFIISDTHFGHSGVTKFLRSDGTKLRPWDNVEEMDEFMVDAWNNIVRSSDKVYHLGDVVINRKALSILSRLNGDKVLIKGNHDLFRLNEYLNHFRDIRAFHVLDQMMLAHIPVHPQSKGRFKAQIHGHLHSNIIMKEDPNTYINKTMIPDEWYINVCVEHTNYAPIALEEIRSRVDKNNL
jgi:calcineurin-like phosphoesterase family protein